MVKNRLKIAQNCTKPAPNWQVEYVVSPALWQKLAVFCNALHWWKSVWPCGGDTQRGLEYVTGNGMQYKKGGRGARGSEDPELPL